MDLILVSFVAGILTALAPCVLPLLPVIIGGSLAGTERRRPYLIVAALAGSLILFTLALKATTALLNVPAVVWTTLSGGLVLALGIVTIWPGLYERISAGSGFLNASQNLLDRSRQRRGWVQPLLIGAALGPVFASCSPTYGLIVATILPVSFGRGLVYLVIYALGLSVFLLAVALAGRRLIGRLGWAVNPSGWFHRSLGVLFVLVGLAILTGFDKTAENWLTDHQIFDATRIEQQLQRADSQTTTASNGAKFAITDPTPAPELTGLTNWINSSPQTLASLRGKVVVIDFWTYSCINCIHTLPHVEKMYEKYKDSGLVVLGLSAPEFAFEHVPANVAQAVKDDHLTYPVALDNDLATWRAYNNQYWPAEYFIDRQGQLRHYAFGEGDYDNDELVIRSLLAEGGNSVAGSPEHFAGPASGNQSPETYLGYERAERNANSSGLQNDQAASYSLPSDIPSDGWALGGSWKVGAWDTVAGSNATLRYRFTGSQVYLVMGSNSPAHVQVLLNGQPVTAAQAGSDVTDGTATVSGPRLYRLIKSPTPLSGALLELRFDPGISVNAFTFDQ